MIKALNDLHPEVDTIDAAMGSVEIIEAMRGYNLAVIVDAIETGAAPGTVFRVNLTQGEVPPVVTHSHGTDLITTLQLGRQLYGEEMPGEIILLAVEAEDTITIGDELTPRVGVAVQETLKTIISLMEASRRARAG